MNRTIDPDALSEVALFRDLTPEQLSRLKPLLHRRSFPAGATVIAAEEPGESAYVIVAGSVKVHVEEPDGSDVILAILGPGEIVGEMSVADSLGRSASVLTLEESTLLHIDGAAFRTSVREMPAMARNLVNILSRRLRLANTHVRSLAALDVYGRVAAQLLAFAREYGETAPNGDVLIPLRLTQFDLASLVGASRVRVNQATGYYRGRKHISVGRDHRITVHDGGALARRCR
jgi:CRP/FNR family cyclic AMP-dependent transcriptional regulator